MVETSPDGRYRFVKEGTGGGAGTAYDTENGLLVGWNVLNLREMSVEKRESAKRSINLLKGLNHSHVLGVHSCWNAPLPSTASKGRPPLLLRWQAEQGAAYQKEEDGDADDEEEEEKGEGQEGRIVFLTTPCITLEAFINTKVEFLRWRVVKRWSAQVLEALAFLHQQSPPVVHKHMSLSTIYIDTSKSHLFVGGVENIVAPSCPTPRRPAPPTSGSSSVGGGRGNGRGGYGRSTQRNGQKSWGGKAWHLVVGSGGGGGAGHVRSGSGGGSVEPDSDHREFGGKDDGHCDKDKDKDIDQDGRVNLDRELAAAAVEGGVGGGVGGRGGGGDGGGGATLVAEGGRGAAGGEEEPQAAAAAAAGGAEPEGAPRDVRTLGTVLIEMVLKKRLDPELAECDQFLEALPTISGWPSSVVDFLRLCRAPPQERPSAAELLCHPFLQVGTEIDDEPIYGDVELIAAAGKAAVAAAAAEEEQEEGVLGAEAPGGPGGAPGANSLGAPPAFLPLLVTTTTSSSGVTSSLLSSSALRAGGGSAATSPSSSASAAVAAAAEAAASAAAEVPVVAVAGSRRSCFRFRRGPVTPTPLFVSNSISSATASGKDSDQRDPACAADFDGGGRREGAGGLGREWSSYARSPGYPPSCVSTESPSPSSPSAAPSFGGVPTTPSPPAARGFSYDLGNSGGGGAGTGVGTGPAGAGAPAGVGGGGGAVAPGAGGGVGGVGGWGGLSVRGRAGGIVGRTGSLPFLPPGVSAATLANATAIAARMGGSFSSNAPRQQQHPFRAGGGGGGRGMATLSGGRNRSMSYSDRQHMLNAAGAGGGVGGGGGAGGRGDRFGAGFLGGSFAEGGGAGGSGGVALGNTNASMGSMVGRSRSASEDAVWDLLPSDESQCRRPFSVSAVEGRHGCL